MKPGPSAAECFDRVDRVDRAYRVARDAVLDGVVRESPLRHGAVAELELQARISSGEFGVDWSGEDGESVQLIHFGTWNREPGPDFCGAKMVINGVETTGDIEIDGEAADWENHGHARNEAYNNVILHVFFRRGGKRFFTRTSEHQFVPQVCLTTGLCRRSVRREPPAETLDDAKVLRLIEAAVRFRMHRKAAGFQRTCALCGRDDALFQAIAVGLGYKNNKIPFLLVAQRAGLERAKGAHGEALLFGLAGFLDARQFDAADDENRDYLRNLWEQWWLVRNIESRLTLPENAWKFAALRPANHPHRRMGALAAVARGFSKIRAAADARNVTAFRDSLESLTHPFWVRHASLARDRLVRETALIGQERTLDLAINVLIPSLPADKRWESLGALPGPPPNRKVLAMTEWLCGAARPDLSRSASRQQGLLQLHEDFFRQDPAAIWRSFARALE